jgi:hypothetical protein
LAQDQGSKGQSATSDVVKKLVNGFGSGFGGGGLLGTHGTESHKELVVDCMYAVEESTIAGTCSKLARTSFTIGKLEFRSKFWWEKGPELE